MKYNLLSILILLFSISVVFGQPDNSVIEKNRIADKEDREFESFSNYYLHGPEKGHRFPYRQKGQIHSDVNTDEFFEKFPIRFGPDPLRQNYRDRTHLRDGIDRMRDMMMPYYPNRPGSPMEQNNTLSDGVEETWVSHYASGLAPSDDGAVDIVIDSSGNIYVTGYSTMTYGIDYFTTKYDPSGVMHWSVRYDGGVFDMPSDIEIDGQGYVYVTGHSYSLGTGFDYATVKYNPAGVEQWVVRYNGPGNYSDFAQALALDNQGNVYVTGTSWDSGPGGDYATVKYNAEGVEQWVARYNGLGNDDDFPYDLTLDSQGNVFVTGGSDESSGHALKYEYATVKYNSAGVQQWVAHYRVPGGTGGAQALALDGQGNVYVTGGYSVGGSGTSCDYATVKYNTAGVEQWVARYNGPGNSYDAASALALDGQGNVFVTGLSSCSVANRDYATVKYDTAGVEQWVARYNGPGNGSDEVNALALDVQGNVVVTGFSLGSETNDYATVKYNASGVEQWVTRYNGPGNGSDEASGLALDVQGNVVVTGFCLDSGTNYDFATVKYDAAGVEQWVTRYNGPGKSKDYANALALDKQGNVVVTGYSYGSGTDDDYATVKYDAAGVEQWVARYNGPGNAGDGAIALALDDQDNVYVTGASLDSGTNWDYATIKYNAAGVEQWVVEYNGPGNGKDVAYALAVDGKGNVFVTGYSLGSEALDYATVKYNAAGVEQWVARYKGPGNGNDVAYALAVDVQGNVYVTGSSVGLDAFYGYATVKYNTSGEQQWVTRYNGPGNGDDIANALAVDSQGNAYVTGYSNGEETDWDYATVKYDAAGVEQWVARYNGSGNSADYLNVLAVDVQGNVYVTGSSVGLDAFYGYATVKYNTSGEQQWVTRYNGPGNGDDIANALAVDSQGNAYVTGYSNGEETDWDYATVKYDTAGVEQWVARYNRLQNAYDVAMALAVDGQGNVIVTGNTGNYSGILLGSEWNIYTTIKYIQTPTGIEQEILNTPSACNLEQNYPNPFNPTTTIEFSIPKPEFVTLKVYDILGEEVATLVSEKLRAGKHRYEFDAQNFSSGIYYYQLVAGEYVTVKKMILLK